MLMYFGLPKFCVVNPREGYSYIHSTICTDLAHLLTNSLELHMIAFLENLVASCGCRVS